MARVRRRLARPRKPFESVISKDVLAKEIDRIIQARQLTQTEVAYIIKDAPSQISLVVTGKVRGFSAERLLRMLSRLGRDIDVIIRPKSGPGHGRIRVVRQ